jgi:TolB-like protein/tetratricopeptide (TPR) repeat protein
MSEWKAPVAARIAVTPLRFRPTDPAAARLADGFLEDVIAELARFPEFEVLSARTSLALAPHELDFAHLAERFGTTHLLDSTVAPSKEALQVKTNLIEVPSGVQLWNQRYDVALHDLFAVQDDVAAHVANHLKGHLHSSRLARAKTRPIAALEVYDCWLRGHHCLAKGTVAADVEARELFERALTLDPTYARAYVGLSLSHFNEWSCQLWSEWETSERLAYEYAKKAVELDETDHLAHAIVGRILVYRREFAQARRHLERAVALCPNDADNLAHNALWQAYLGEPEVGIQMAEKAFRLNPLHDAYYDVFGALPYFVARRTDEGLRIGERAPPSITVDHAAFMAAMYAHADDLDAAQKHLGVFLHTFREKITFGRTPAPDEPLAYLLHVNPFARAEDVDYFIEGLHCAGLGGSARRGVAYLPPSRAADATFVLDPATGAWTARFMDRTARVKDMKGCRDLALLLSSPCERLHVIDIAGRALEGDAGAVMDARARAECQRRRHELEEEIADAEREHDLGRREAAQAELERLTESLLAALGIGGRPRKLGDPIEKARTAVTWRIRSAIKKIGEAHPELGRHLEHSIRTGTFCEYRSETPISWRLTM